MKKIITTALAALFLILLHTEYANSQTVTLYGMRNIPQYGYDNPARLPGCKVYVGFPALSSIAANTRFMSLSYNDIFTPHPNGEDYYIDINNIQKNLGKNNLLGAENHLVVAEFGFWFAGNRHFSFSVRNKTQQFLNFPKRNLEIRHGNYKEDGTPIIIELNQEAINYTEYSFGYAQVLLNDMTIAGRLNIYNGNAHLKTNNFKVEWHTASAEEDMYAWNFITDIDINAAAIPEWEIVTDENGIIEDIQISDIKESDYIKFALGRNIGVGLDLGVSYPIFDWLSASASVKDFGFIQWKSNAQKISSNAEFEFTGIDIGDYFESLSDLDNIDLGEAIVDDFIDTLTQMVKPTIQKQAYSSMLHTKFFAGAEFHPYNWLDLGVLYHGILINSNLYSALSFSANTSIGKRFAFTANYSIANRAYNNIGVGLAYSMGPLQMYFVTDNIAPALYMWDKDFTRDHLYATKSVNIHFGINLVFCGPKTDYGLLF